MTKKSEARLARDKKVLDAAKAKALAKIKAEATRVAWKLKMMTSQTKEEFMTYETISDNPAIQAEYEAMRAKGESHNMAEMLALQQFPFSRDENQILFKGEESGKLYISQLARYPGDPRAYVSNASDVRRIAEEDNLTVDGAVNVKRSRDVEPTPDIAIADDIVDENVAIEIAMDPGKATKIEQVREETRERLTAGKIA